MQLDPERCRSLLFVPAGNERFLNSALRGDADVIQIDLEDAIAPNQKEVARGHAKKDIAISFFACPRATSFWFGAIASSRSIWMTSASPRRALLRKRSLPAGTKRSERHRSGSSCIVFWDQVHDFFLMFRQLRCCRWFFPWSPGQSGNRIRNRTFLHFSIRNFRKQLTAYPIRMIE